MGKMQSNTPKVNKSKGPITVNRISTTKSANITPEAPNTRASIENLVKKNYLMISADNSKRPILSSKNVVVKNVTNNKIIVNRKAISSKNLDKIDVKVRPKTA